MRNREQIELWNGPAAEGWIRRGEALDGILAELTEVALRSAGFRRGEKVLDLGCGCGTTSLAIARRVGPDGAVIGLDISRPMLVVARRRAREAGLENLRFEAVDVQDGDLGSGADAAFSRFGLMFFADPLGAFGNILGALRSGGRLQFLAWAEPERNPFLSVPLGEAARRLERNPAAPGTPGPFGLADAESTRRLLELAGFEEIVIEAREPCLRLPSSRELFDLLVELTPGLRAAVEGLARRARKALLAAIDERLASYRSGEGLELPARVWWVSAWRAFEAA
ncbi:MAG: class I SAM-dependent methyltransferase [Myxococcota bacterium]